jgi:hypothetical protein
MELRVFHPHCVPSNPSVVFVWPSCPGILADPIPIACPTPCRPPIVFFLFQSKHQSCSHHRSCKSSPVFTQRYFFIGCFFSQIDKKLCMVLFIFNLCAMFPRKRMKIAFELNINFVGCEYVSVFPYWHVSHPNCSSCLVLQDNRLEPCLFLSVAHFYRS